MGKQQEARLRCAGLGLSLARTLAGLMTIPSLEEELGDDYTPPTPPTRQELKEEISDLYQEMLIAQAKHKALQEKYAELKRFSTTRHVVAESLLCSVLAWHSGKYGYTDDDIIALARSAAEDTLKGDVE